MYVPWLTLRNYDLFSFWWGSNVCLLTVIPGNMDSRDAGIKV